MEIRCSCCCFALFELTRSGSLHWHELWCVTTTLTIHGRYRSVLACELRSSLAVRSLCIFLFMNVCRDLTAAKTTTAATVEAMMVILLSRVRALFNSNRVSKKYQKEAHTFYMYWLEYIAWDRAGKRVWTLNLTKLRIHYRIHTHVVDSKHANGNVTIAVNNNNDKGKSKIEYTYVHTYLFTIKVLFIAGTRGRERENRKKTHWKVCLVGGVCKW